MQGAVLRLTVATPIEENCKELIRFVQGLPKPKSHAAATDPATVLLEVKELPRTEILQVLQRLYDVSVVGSMGSNVDIVPLCEGATITKDRLRSAGFVPSYGYIAMGGTFDRMHAGHKMLLTSSALHAIDKLRVGVTGAELLKAKKNAQLVQSFEVRQHSAMAFAARVRPDLELEPCVVTEASGGTDKIAEVEAMVLSPETWPVLAAINATRVANGLKPMEGISIEYVGGDASTRVSSTKLRELELQSSS